MRVHYLDSLRGIAALSVVIFHFTGGFGIFPGVPAFILRTPLTFIKDGIGAVGLFYVLSGFVLTFKPFRKPEGYSLRDSLDTFLIRRVMRILPPFMAWVVISALCQRYLLHFSQDLPGQSSWLKAIWAEHASLSRVLREFVITNPVAGTSLCSSPSIRSFRSWGACPFISI
jgi:peptidoglycan/LPS O-acetylase OafA/YrhL